MCFNQTGDISTLDGSSLKLVDKFTYLGSSVSSTKKDIDKLSIIRKSDLTDKMKHSFFQAAVLLILLYACTTWTLTKQMEKKLDGNNTRMLRAILKSPGGNTPQSTSCTVTYVPSKLDNQTCRTLLKKQRRAHKWCSLMDPSYDRAKAGQPAWTYIQQLCEDTGCSPEDLLKAMNDWARW